MSCLVETGRVRSKGVVVFALDKLVVPQSHIGQQPDGISNKWLVCTSECKASVGLWGSLVVLVDSFLSYLQLVRC